MNQAKSSFEDLCKQVTGSNGYSDEIDGILKDFGKLEQKLRGSKKTVGKFIQQQTQKANNKVCIIITVKEINYQLRLGQ